MAITESYKVFIEDQLYELREYESKKMFGGIGYFINGDVFAALMDDIFMMKVTDGNREDFLAYGMEPWSPPGRKMKMPYYPVPEEIINDKALLKEWSLKAWNLSKK